MGKIDLNSELEQVSKQKKKESVNTSPDHDKLLAELELAAGQAGIVDKERKEKVKQEEETVKKTKSMAILIVAFAVLLIIIAIVFLFVFDRGSENTPSTAVSSEFSGSGVNQFGGSFNKSGVTPGGVNSSPAPMNQQGFESDPM